jgi:hypothetical protein
MSLTVVHAFSTCRWATTSSAVVDSSGRVHGFDNLRARRSVLPDSPGVNPQGTMAIALRNEQRLRRAHAARASGGGTALPASPRAASHTGHRRAPALARAWSVSPRAPRGPAFATPVAARPSAAWCRRAWTSTRSSPSGRCAATSATTPLADFYNAEGAPFPRRRLVHPRRVADFAGQRGRRRTSLGGARGRTPVVAVSTRRSA